jgi:cation transport ATPase
VERHSEHELAWFATPKRAPSLYERFDSVTGGGVVGKVQGRGIIVGNHRLLESNEIAVLDSLKADRKAAGLTGTLSFMSPWMENLPACSLVPTQSKALHLRPLGNFAHWGSGL